MFKVRRRGSGVTRGVGTWWRGRNTFRYDLISGTENSGYTVDSV
jgi:hypothetical protein